MSKAEPTLLVVGNSVSLAPADGVPGYPERVAKRATDWRQVVVIDSGATVEELAPRALDAIRAVSPEAVIVQVGINDCAPRPWSPRQRRWLGRLKPLALRQRIISAIHRWRPQIIRLRPLAQNAPLEKFDAAVGRLVAAARACGATVLLLPIPPIHEVAEARTPFANREIARDATALRRHAGEGVSYVDTETLFHSGDPSTYCITPASVHWNATAHDRAAQYIVTWLSLNSLHFT